MEITYYDKESDIARYIGSIDRGATVSLDLETTGLDPRHDSITDVAICDGDNVVVFDGRYVKRLSGLRDRVVILHNFKFDAAFLMQVGVDIVEQCTVHDTMLMHHLYDENASHGLDSIIQEWYNDPYKETFWATYKRIQDAPKEAQIQYAGSDVLYTLKIYRRLRDKLGVYGLLGTYDHVRKLAFKLYRTELKGIKVDKEYLTSIGSKLSTEIERLKGEMRTMADLSCQAVEMDMYAVELDKRKTPAGKARVKQPRFNWDSQKQQCRLIYEQLGLPMLKNKRGNPTLDDNALAQLKDKHPIVPKLQEYRKNKKVFGAFIEGTIERMVEGRVYPNFNVNGTVTGRISSSNPNLQQLPRDGGVRGIYVPDSGCKFVCADYSQLEICLAAHFSKDPVLLEIVRKGDSMHDYTASALGIPRQMAKTINFLTIYGGSEFKLAKVMDVPIPQAKRYLEKLWKTYKGLKEVIDECHAKVERGEPIINPFGRQRHFPTEYESHLDKERAKRQAFNALIQGTGADLTHAAFYSLEHALFEVHDEIVGMPPESEVVSYREQVEKVMTAQGKDWLTVPLRVDVSEGLDRWCK